jgi:hypothetical protein
VAQSRYRPTSIHDLNFLSRRQVGQQTRQLGLHFLDGGR